MNRQGARNPGILSPSQTELEMAGADCAAILADFDGTLYHQVPMRLLMAAELLLFGAGAIGALRVFRREQERLRSLSVSPSASTVVEASPFQQQLANAATAAGMTRERMQAIVDEWMFRRPGKWLRPCVRRQLVEELEARRTAGVKLAVVSDYPVRRKLGALDLSLEFDAIVANGESGGPTTLKPNPEGCLLAAARVGVSPGRCLVVGDREEVDGAAARRAGMSFLLVR